MVNQKLTIAYDGSAYHGWQIQDNSDTVQGRFEKAVERVYGEHISVNGCSRTDTGVHANEFCLNFRSELDIADENLVRAVNTYLPDDIAVLKCEKVDYDFHARFDCKSKQYIYRIKSCTLKDPFNYNRVLLYKYPLDAEIMNTAAALFKGKHDFSCFCASGSTTVSNVRTVYQSEVKQVGDEIVFTVAADGFLYNMVRIMTGTLLYVSQGKIAVDEIPDIIKSHDRTRAGITAPACGLYLNKVNYIEVK